MSSAETDMRDRLQQALGDAYVVERELGGGGMSRVFVAEESALGRQVVVKVLRPELAEGLSAERFKREVRLAARLQHPHIVPLLAAGALPGGVLYYTMPYIEGDSLRARLEREGALPIATATRVARDIASALSYAHRQAVVHRDIKPENVLLSDGPAMVADFGIAKAISLSAADAADGDVRRSSTLTAAGTSLGTPAYMAPEQAAGDVVDHRADLYALGVVAYEMLAGRPPFDGRTAQQLLAAHATESPEPIGRRRPAVPPALGALVMRLLEKQPGDRPQTADEVLRALDTVTDTAATDARDTPVPMRRRVPTWALGVAAAAIAGAALGAAVARARKPPVVPIAAAILAPPGHELRPDASLALSPDGSRLAFVAADERGAVAIWIRALGKSEADRIDGTDGGSGPFWSPNGTSLGFFAAGQLRVLDLRAGTRRALCPAPRPGGGTWTSTGTIVYSPDFLSVPLFKVSAEGGACTQLTKYRPGDFDHRRPVALPDGRHVLFSSFRANAALVVDLETGEITEVRRPGNEAQFAPPNWLLFRDNSSTQFSPIYAQRFDLRALRPIGEPRVVLDRASGIGGLSRFAATERAFVALRPSASRVSLVRVDEHSAIVDSVVAPADAGPLASSANVAPSHDNRRIAFGGMGLWLHDRDRSVATRVRAETMPGQGILDPAWDPADSLIAYSTVYQGPIMLRLYHVATGTSDSLFASGRRNIRTPNWSPDGRTIAYQLSAGDTVPRDEIWLYNLADRRASRAWDSAANLASPRWSPDGAWMAYVSTETGAPEVYLRPMSGRGVAVPVSTSGGEAPRWRADGRALYYRAPDGAIMAVDVRLGAVTAALSQPHVAVASPPFTQTVRGFDVTPDGKQFIGIGRSERPVFTLLFDWPAQLLDAK